MPAEVAWPTPTCASGTCIAGPGHNEINVAAGTGIQVPCRPGEDKRASDIRARDCGVALGATQTDGILPDVLEGRIEPGRVFDRTVGLDGVPGGYRAMAGRQSRKVLSTP